MTNPPDRPGRAAAPDLPRPGHRARGLRRSRPRSPSRLTSFAATSRTRDDWFIETAGISIPHRRAIGYRPGAKPSPPETSAARVAAAISLLVPRRDVARTIAHRRRKGTLALSAAGADVADWPTRAVEHHPLLVTQHEPLSTDAAARSTCGTATSRSSAGRPTTRRTSSPLAASAPPDPTPP
jgi:hypothetical protein